MQKNLGKIKRTVEEYVVLTVATLILVVGVYVFKFPNNFSTVPHFSRIPPKDTAKIIRFIVHI